MAELEACTTITVRMLALTAQGFVELHTNTLRNRLLRQTLKRASRPAMIAVVKEMFDCCSSNIVSRPSLQIHSHHALQRQHSYCPVHCSCFHTYVFRMDSVCPPPSPTVTRTGTFPCFRHSAVVCLASEARRLQCCQQSPSRSVRYDLQEYCKLGIASNAKPNPGPFVRISPNEVSINEPSAVQLRYGTQEQIHKDRVLYRHEVAGYENKAR